MAQFTSIISVPRRNNQLAKYMAGCWYLGEERGGGGRGRAEREGGEKMYNSQTFFVQKNPTEEKGFGFFSVKLHNQASYTCHIFDTLQSVIPQK